MHPSENDQVVAILVIAAFVAICLYRYRWKGSGTAFGVAAWRTEKEMRAGGMLAGNGLIVGRTFTGALIRLREFCHVLVCGSTGSGKGVSIFIPNLLTWFRSSILCFDTKGDLYETTASRRAARGERIIRLAPFSGGEDAFNPLDTIHRDSPMLVDSARALAEALVVRKGSEPDPYWNDKSVQVICAVLVLVLLKFKEEERNLCTVQEIVSDLDTLRAASQMLQQIGGIPGRQGAQPKTLFDASGLTKEGAGVVGNITRHLSFLDSELVAKAVATSTFHPAELRRPGTTAFIQIGQDQLEAQGGLLRYWTSAAMRVISAAGNERDGEVLCLFDEASALGSLPALEETLVRGRSAGLRLVLAYQSPSQVTAAFKDKETLIYDNTSSQVQIGAPSGYEAAERLSKALGDWTQVVEQYGENQSGSWQTGASQSGSQMSRGSSMTYSETGRALLRPEELLTLNNDSVIVLERGRLPILAQRVKWYQDPEFNSAPAKKRQSSWLSQYVWLRQYSWLWTPPPWKWQLVVAGVIGVILLALLNRVNH